MFNFYLKKRLLMAQKRFLLFSLSFLLVGNNSFTNKTEYTLSGLAGAAAGAAAGALTSVTLSAIAKKANIDFKTKQTTTATALSTAIKLSVGTGTVVGATGGLACQYFNPANGAKDAALNPLITSGKGISTGVRICGNSIYSGTSVCSDIIYNIITNQEIRNFGKNIIIVSLPVYLTHWLNSSQGNSVTLNSSQGNSATFDSE